MATDFRAAAGRAQPNMDPFGYSSKYKPPVADKQSPAVQPPRPSQPAMQAYQQPAQPFQAYWGSPMGGYSQTPTTPQRDAFINNINEQMIPYYTGQASGPPQFNIQQAWDKGGQMVQDGWQNPFAQMLGTLQAQSVPPVLPGLMPMTGWSQPQETPAAAAPQWSDQQIAQANSQYAHLSDKPTVQRRPDGSVEVVRQGPQGKTASQAGEPLQDSPSAPGTQQGASAEAASREAERAKRRQAAIEKRNREAMAVRRDERLLKQLMAAPQAKRGHIIVNRQWVPATPANAQRYYSEGPGLPLSNAQKLLMKDRIKWSHPAFANYGPK